MLDTTCRIMYFYTTSILTACVSNRRVRDKKIINFLIKTAEKQFYFSFKKKIIESDQGSELKGICNDLYSIHVSCTRHLLAGLKYSAYSYKVQHIVCCERDFEFRNCINLFSTKFDQICTQKPHELKYINLALKKKV